MNTLLSAILFFIWLDCPWF